MKSLPYVIGKKALTDLDDIWYYTVEKWSVDQANRYYDLIFEEIGYICKRPHSGKSMDDIRKGYRVSKVNHILSFTKLLMTLLRSLEFYINEWILRTGLVIKG